MRDINSKKRKLSKMTDDDDDAELKAKAHVLLSLYSQGYEPPKWALRMVGSNDWLEFAEQVEVLSFDEREKTVRFVAKQREPVNLSMVPKYDKIGMKDHFGWEESGYSTVFKEDSSRLPPNIALYVKTPVNQSDGPVVHVINAVGFAFDSKDQPDYQYFVKGQRLPELKASLIDVFLLVFACAARKELTTVALCLLGAGAFSEQYPGGSERYLSDVYFPALQDALNCLPPAATPSEIGMMGDPDAAMMAQLCEASGDIPCYPYGFVPFICDEPCAAKTLFMNAWDPHSIVGNGNSSDNSLDGHFGRSSAMAYLSFSSTNPYITVVPPEELLGVIAPAGPGYSPTSPSYSPTSPGYFPTSP